MDYSAVNTIWVLVGAALVFFMQADLLWWRQVSPELKMQVTLL